MKTTSATALASAAALALLAASPAAAQATRTWVSGVGDDANPCSRTAPCKTFAGAISKTAANGEISVLDPGGFGVVTITKNISINAEWGGEAGVLASGTNGINVPTAGIIVNLRGLYIEGAGTGLNGINITGAGATVNIQDCVIKGFRGANGLGIRVVPAGAATTEVNVTNTVISDNLQGGVLIAPTGGAAVRLNASFDHVEMVNNTGFGLKVDATGSTSGLNVSVTNSNFAANGGDGVLSSAATGSGPFINAHNVSSNGNQGAGFHADGALGRIRIGGSTAMGNNGAGVSATNSGVILSYGNNQLDGNGAANSPTNPLTPG